MKIYGLHRLNAQQITLIGFTIIILLGAIALVLPFSNNGDSLSFLDALFTSTSATCVTGLIVVDTATQFSLFGQFIILFLIQIGGYGIMTLSSYILFMSGKNLSLHLRDGAADSFLDLHVYDLSELIKKSIIVVTVCEAVTAVLLFSQFIKDFSFLESCWYAVFHSVSSFCNAGFSLFKDSMISYNSNPVINISLIIAIIAGGIGFFVIIDLLQIFKKSNRPLKRRLSFHSKIVLSMTALLIVIGAVMFFAIEREYSLSQAGIGKSILISFFQSVTTRTAGFNSVDFAHLSNSSLFLFILLMFVGGAPGSMAGGIKVTSVGILTILVISKLKGRNQLTAFERAVSDENLEKGLTVILIALGVIILCVLLLLLTELGGVSHQDSRGKFLEILFEAVSAFGTVGLSTGVTPELSTAGRVIVIILMLIGRLGPLTIVYALNRKKKSSSIRYPDEKILIG